MATKHAPVALLAKWMLDNEVSQSDLAPRVGVSQPTLSRILAEKQHPEDETKKAIERETGIKASLWGKRLRKDSRAALKALARKKAAA